MSNYYGKYYDYENGSVIQKERPNDTSIEINSWVKPMYSVISFGTEQWQMQQRNATYQAGYISIGFDNKYIISPTPHGAFFNKTNPQNLIVNTSLDIKEICVTRFQLIAAYSLSNSLLTNLSFNEVSIIGSGAVAIGTALEFLRQNYKVKILTRRISTVRNLFSDLNVEISEMEGNELGNFIIDCIGTQESINFIVDFSKPNSVIGILGSPRSSFHMDLYSIHRKGLFLIGLHELNNFVPNIRQTLFDEICKWIKCSIHVSSLWFQFKDSKEFVESMNSFKTTRTVEPFLIFRW